MSDPSSRPQQSRSEATRADWIAGGVSLALNSAAALWCVAVLRMAMHWWGYEGENWGVFIPLFFGLPTLGVQVLFLLPLTLFGTTGTRRRLPSGMTYANWIAFGAGLAMNLLATLSTWGPD